MSKAPDFHWKAARIGMGRRGKPGLAYLGLLKSLPQAPWSTSVKTTLDKSSGKKHLKLREIL